MDKAEKLQQCYVAGYDCGVNGPTKLNCNHIFFSTEESLKAWEEGEAAGLTSSMLGNVRQLHEKMKMPYNGVPRHLSQEDFDRRIIMMREELKEYENATTLTGQLDALVDLVYFTLGTAYLQGLPFMEAWKEIHNTNMCKEIATPENPSARGYTSDDLVKPENWVAPDLSSIIDRREKEKC